MRCGLRATEKRFGYDLVSDDDDDGDEDDDEDDDSNQNAMKKLRFTVECRIEDVNLCDIFRLRSRCVVLIFWLWSIYSDVGEIDGIRQENLLGFFSD